MLRDQFRLGRDWQRCHDDKETARKSERTSKFCERLNRSIEIREERTANLPTPAYDQTLPIFQRRQEIIDAIREHQVIVVSGATGSGKSTQLPLIALESGFGKSGFIGHTQPRRIAARGVSARIAQQLKTAVGEQVGFKIRFADKTNDKTYIKLMTDGILLAETQTDRFLEQYELLIVDEAHERSLNIDFLLGYLKKILRKRPEFRLIITSATIDTEKFAEHFTEDPKSPVPVINVEGRTFPVEIEYRDPAYLEAEQESPDRMVVQACEDLASRDSGDILVFLPTEAEIRNLNKLLKQASFRGPTEILPLYARLSTQQQNLIFEPSKKRKIVLATNVAESSITVPGIKYVIDTGTARISRYAPRSKVQRLPIEPISQASANQRAGRCGRVEPGVCVRLYSEEDFAGRNEFTTPEIRRTNLASVILQTLSLKLGDITQFPFIDPPGPEAIRDGYKTLTEIGAVDRHRKLTPLGRKLAKLPVDPRIGRMIYEADSEHCLAEVLIIASSLEVQDPRMRPAEKQKQADEKHQQFADPKSDFMARLKLWDFFHQLKEDLSRSKLRIATQKNFLSYTLMQQWLDIHRQLKGMVESLGLKPRKRKDDYDGIHRSLLSGLLSGVGMLGDRHEYTGAGGIKFHLWPGSGVFESKPKWIVASELVETTRRYGRTVAKILPEWIESLAEHMVKRQYFDPVWSRRKQTVLADEKVSLYGLPIANRKTQFGRINPEEAREVFIEQGLAAEAYTGPGKFYSRNLQLLEDIKSEAAKTRNRELIVDSYLVAGFYEQNLPAKAFDARSLKQLMSKFPGLDRQLTMSRENLLPEQASGLDANLFPNQVQIGKMEVPVEYAFAPGDSNDGATIEIPLQGLGQVDDIQTGWLIPGLMPERIVALIRSLPKSLRRNLVPAPETAAELAKDIPFGEGSFLASVAKHLTQKGGLPIQIDDFKLDKVDAHLNVNLRVVGDEGEVLAEGRNIATLREQLGAELGDQLSTNVVDIADEKWQQEQLTDWTFDELPEQVTVQRGATRLAAFPTLMDDGDSVSLRLVDSEAAADNLTRRGLVRLYQLKQKKAVKSQVRWLPNLDQHALRLNRAIPAPDLKRQLGDLIVSTAFVGAKKLPRNLEEFLARLDTAAEKIGVATQEIALWLPKFSEAFHQAQLFIESMPGKFSSAKGDIREQIKFLTGEDFLGQTPWEWLRNYPRYFQAIALRIEKLPSTPQEKDRAAREQIAFHWKRMAELKQRQEVQAIVDPERIKYRWMIEEFRVSLFAQNLGTALTVSEKRLEKQWAKVRLV